MFSGGTKPGNIRESLMEEGPGLSEGRVGQGGVVLAEGMAHAKAWR